MQEKFSLLNLNSVENKPNYLTVGKKLEDKIMKSSNKNKVLGAELLSVQLLARNCIRKS